MKGFIATLASVLLGAMMVMMSPPARADGPIDCTNGCEIVTCTATYCDVWHCDTSGCIRVGGYQRNRPRSQIAPTEKHPAAFSAVCDVSGKQACAVKSCANGQCTVSLFDGRSFVPVGRIEDVDSLINRANRSIQK